MNGLIFDNNGLRLCTDNDYALESLCLYVPEFSVLWHPLVDFKSTIPAPMRPAALGACLFWLMAFLYVARDLLRITWGQANERIRARVARHWRGRWNV